MEQPARPKRPRPTSLQINVLRVQPIAELSTASHSSAVSSSGKTMSYNYQRPRDPSPGSRRLQNPGRLSDNTLTDPYYSQRHGSYASPRSSGVIPISTQTFVTIPSSPTNNTSSASARPEPRFDSYSGRPRRASLVDTTRGGSSATQLPVRSRPNVVQQDVARPGSPSKPGQAPQPSREYYVMPASSQEPRTGVSTHKKLYSVDDGGAKLVADVNIPVQAGGERQHKRRDSTERSGYRNVERDRGGRGYHVNGAHIKPREKSIDDDDAYSYTDPASMYRDTEPRWREVRPRRGSIDRSGGASRERPVSMLDPTFVTRQTAKEVGPPPSTRGWDKINDIGRARSVRDPREIAQSPTRGRVYQEPGAYGEPRDPYYVQPRTNSTDRRTTINNYDSHEYDNREPRRPERRHSITRDNRADRSIERRGFGIRTDFRNESQTRHTGREGRGSDESFEQARYRDSGYGEPHRRETAPDFVHQDVGRLEQEKRDRETAERLQAEEYGRSRQRGYSDSRDFSREPRRRDDDRVYERDYERHQERDRSRVDRPADRERERHHHRRDTDRDREYGRNDGSPRQGGENVAKPGLTQAATGGLAGAAAAFGLTNLLNKVADKRDKDKEDYQDRDRERDSDRERKLERERGERRERQNGEDRDHPRERRQAASDEYEDHERHKDVNPGLGFAFEAPEPPKSAPPMTNAEFSQDRKPEWSQPGQDGQTQTRNQERDGQRDSDREKSRGNKPYEAKPPVEMPAPPVDPDEDYRRRMEQVQRELGRTSDEQRASESDADRERRRREREQRQRDREGRSGANTSAGAESGFRDDLSSYASTVGTDLKRKPSILDQPMTDEPEQMAHIIDNSMSDRRENRVRIVEPPTDEEEKKPKGILKKPTEKFPEDPNAVREGVAPLKDATKKGIPPGARWTKIDRRLVNPEALEAAQERFEERLDCVIVLRVLTKEEIQKLADRTREIRDRRYEEERAERKASRRSDRNRYRHDGDEYEHSNSDDEFKPKAPKLLEAPSTAGASSNNADFIRENRDRRSDREREAEPSYMSGALGRRDESQARY